MDRATAEGTERYSARYGSSLAPGHFRKSLNWTISSIGLGTYLGEMDAATDHGYTAAAMEAMMGGCNLLDTAINYRFQRSERSLAAALKDLIAKGSTSRDEIVVCSKGGFLSFDGDFPSNPAKYIHDNYIQTGVIKEEDIVAGSHCMTPAYLENQIDRSLKNLGLECIDVYFIHNPETQLGEITRQEFMRRMLAAFRMLEKKVAEGKIQVFGAATWNGFRENPRSPSYLSLEELIGLARDAGGEDHHFRAIQLPMNLAMPEAFLSKNQKLGSRSVSLLEAAEKQNMLVLASGSILQGQLAGNLPEAISEFFSDFRTDAQRSIQFVRSTPGVTSALVGMSDPAHVKENMEIAQKPPLEWDKLREIFE